MIRQIISILKKHSPLWGARVGLFLLAGGVVGVLFLASCSTTSAIPDGEQLFTGLKSTEYRNYEQNDHFDAVKEEMEMVLATQPNGALFGSSSVRSPFPVGLWIWNAFSRGNTGFARWMTKSFGKRPVLMSNANPALHALVGESTLQKRGYFNGKISYEQFPYQENKKSKLRYTVDMGHLWTIDTLTYNNFPAEADSMLMMTRPDADIQSGDPFDVATMESERQRVSDLFRDNGYYYYQKNNASFLADSVSVPGKVQLRLQMADGISDSIMRKWYIGKIAVNYRKNFRDQLTDSLKMRMLSLRFKGSNPPLRTRVLLNNLQFRSRQLYSRSKVEKSQQKMNATGLFTSTTFRFTPRPDGSDTLDVTLDCMLDKPYDFYIEAYGKGKTSGRFGPEAIIGITRRNLLRGGELLNVNLHGSYEWQTGHIAEGTDSKLNSYEYGVEASLTFPRIVNPFQVPFRKRIERMRKRGETFRPSGRRRFRSYYDTPTTTLKAAASIINRAEYFKRHTVSGEITYKWMPSPMSSFEFSPLKIVYDYTTSRTLKYIEMLAKHPYLIVAMDDQFIPKMQFSYSYHSPAEYQNPISWWTTVSESANLLSLGYLIGGKKWTEEKTMFKNPYAQFVKLETNFTKVWSLGDKSSLAAHANAGVIWTYGNSEWAPYSEMFYVGGANSIRAFNTRAIGPGPYKSESRQWSYVEQVGDIKFQANLEYRPHLFGKLYGALFLDAGNVWLLRRYDGGQDVQFRMNTFFKQMAVGTGIGLRYDFGLIILRLDWGIGLHVPYETTKSGFYNIDNFKDAQTFHLAIGLPF